ncbi:MAG: sirohydrochlorin cobaltochelatase [Kiritimatiellia bacterium]|jgi:sirohydrochlorin cobaltochelatase|nr:sirohydrochlorin cobaltochelatase [Kiritimatiellia bacterium]MDP6630083.1 sirohydrochlorin cobaltochelatase [Kiritimatiellia bacterium]MDP6811242.1 sirohydrochlorin cobaltochelatase [Kiritimatiellia bacterium]MDP7024585.1 sirohydrochlorin cobaltochelatase [Kiritimatiellia bacterium]
MKKAILLVVPGTTCRQAAPVLERLMTRIDERFSATPHALAYSSTGVHKKLRQKGMRIDTPEEALARLRKAGATHVVVKPLHMVAGKEYRELQESVAQVQSGSRALQQADLTRPLLESQADMRRLIETLIGALPSPQDPSAALVLVAHGSRSAGTDAVIDAASAFCRHLDREVFVGSMISRPNRDDVVARCVQAGVRHAQLAPLMIAAGFSARGDICGDAEGSWKHALEEAGIHCEPILKGLAEYDAVIDLWLDQVDDMLSKYEDTER